MGIRPSSHDYRHEEVQFLGRKVSGARPTENFSYYKWQMASDMKEQYDYVIIGGGSTGAVLAARLSENPDKQVLLLECGPDIVRQDAPFHPLSVNTPGLAQILQGVPVFSRFNYHIVTAPEQGLTCGTESGRRIFQPRGCIIGGSSCLNFMLWVRGSPALYDTWPEGWQWKDVEPYFVKAEAYAGEGSSGKRGTTGPVGVVDASSWPCMEPANELFQQSCENLSRANDNIPDTRINPDYNDPDKPCGVGAAQWNIKDNTRQSSGIAYLTPEVRQRPNLTVAGESFATRIVLEGQRAVGVKFKQGRANMNKGITEHHVMTALNKAPEKFVRATSDVVVSCGALQSPQLLMLSGIGPRQELQRHGIDVAMHLPEVGQNLQDHMFLPTFFEIEDLAAFEAPPQSPPPCGMCSTAATYLRKLTGAPIRTLLFTCSDPEKKIPDIELHMFWGALKKKVTMDLLLALGMNLTDAFWREYLPSVASKKPLCLALPSLLQPKSVGSVGLYSDDPLSYPKPTYNYLSEQDDVETMCYALNLLRKIMKTAPMSSVVGNEIVNKELPNACDPHSKEYTEAYIRSGATTIYHASGTCAIGPVVDSHLRVHGVEGLRVADASVMPKIPAANTNWPCIMVGEKAADLIGGCQTVFE